MTAGEWKREWKRRGRWRAIGTKVRGVHSRSAAEPKVKGSFLGLNRERGERGGREIFQGRLENGRGNRLDIESVPFLPDVKLTVSIKITIERVHVRVYAYIPASPIRMVNQTARIKRYLIGFR